MNKLDSFVSAYRSGSATELENELIMNWYPQRIIKWLENFHPNSLLELGVGHGYTTIWFHKFFKRHVVVEGSGEILKLFRAKHHIDKIEIIQSYFEDYHSDECFDVIIMGFILEHVDNPDLILKKYSQLLKPDGHLYVTVPNAKSMNRRLGLALGKIHDIYELNANDISQGHQRQYCRGTLKELLRAHGFHITREEGIYLKPLPLGYMELMPEFRENLEAMCEVGIEFPDLCVALLMEAQLTA